MSFVCGSARITRICGTLSVWLCNATVRDIDRQLEGALYYKIARDFVVKCPFQLPINVSDSGVAQPDTESAANTSNTRTATDKRHGLDCISYSLTKRLYTFEARLERVESLGKGV